MVEYWFRMSNHQIGVPDRFRPRTDNTLDGRAEISMYFELKIIRIHAKHLQIDDFDTDLLIWIVLYGRARHDHGKLFHAQGGM